VRARDARGEIRYEAIIPPPPKDPLSQGSIARRLPLVSLDLKWPLDQITRLASLIEHHMLKGHIHGLVGHPWLQSSSYLRASKSGIHDSSFQL